MVCSQRRLTCPRGGVIEFGLLATTDQWRIRSRNISKEEAGQPMTRYEMITDR